MNLGSAHLLFARVNLCRVIDWLGCKGYLTLVKVTLVSNCYSFILRALPQYLTNKRKETLCKGRDLTSGS